MLLPSWDLRGLGSGSGPLGSEHQRGQCWGLVGGDKGPCGRTVRTTLQAAALLEEAAVGFGRGGGAGDERSLTHGSVAKS